MKRAGVHGRIFNETEWGGYLLYALWPQGRVIADGRGNYPLDVTEDLALVYDRVTMEDPANGERVRAAYERQGIDAVVHQHPVWPRGYEPPRNAWQPVFSDPKGAIWIRNTERGRAYLAKLQALRDAPLRAPPAPPGPGRRAP